MGTRTLHLPQTKPDLILRYGDLDVWREEALAKEYVVKEYEKNGATWEAAYADGDILAGAFFYSDSLNTGWLLG